MAFGSVGRTQRATARTCAVPRVQIGELKGVGEGKGNDAGGEGGGGRGAGRAGPAARAEMRSRLAAVRAAAALLAAAAAAARAARAARPFGGGAERGAGAQEAALRTGWDGFVDPSRIDVISNGPITRAYVYRSLLSAEECDHIIEMSEKRLTRSGVVDTKSGHSAVSEIRTSSGTFLGRHQDSVVKSVEERLAEWSQVPETHGEGLQILRYEHGQKYDAHFDYFFHGTLDARARTGARALPAPSPAAKASRAASQSAFRPRLLSTPRRVWTAGHSGADARRSRPQRAASPRAATASRPPSSI